MCSGRCFDASPTMARFISTASERIGSDLNCSRVRSRTYSAILSAAFWISARSCLESLGIDNLGHHGRSNVGFQAALKHEIDRFPKEVFQVKADIAVHVVGWFGQRDENIDITVEVCFAAHLRSEQADLNRAKLSKAGSMIAEHVKNVLWREALS